MSNALAPIMLSAEHTQMALPILYAHPVVSHKAIPAFLRALATPSPFIENGETPSKLVRHLTVQASAPSAGRVLPNNLFGARQPTVHPLLPRLFSYLPRLVTFHLKDTLVLQTNDANTLFSALQLIHPKKARLEIRMWDLTDSPFGEDLMAATRPSIYSSMSRSTGSPPGAQGARLGQRSMQMTDAGRCAIQEQWRDALWKGMELDLPSWWIEIPKVPSTTIPGANQGAAQGVVPGGGAGGLAALATIYAQQLVAGAGGFGFQHLPQQAHPHPTSGGTAPALPPAMNNAPPPGPQHGTWPKSLDIWAHSGDSSADLDNNHPTPGSTSSGPSSAPPGAWWSQDDHHSVDSESDMEDEVLMQRLGRWRGEPLAGGGSGLSGSSTQTAPVPPPPSVDPVATDAAPTPGWARLPRRKIVVREVDVPANHVPTGDASSSEMVSIKTGGTIDWREARSALIAAHMATLIQANSAIASGATPAPQPQATSGSHVPIGADPDDFEFISSAPGVGYYEAMVEMSRIVGQSTQPAAPSKVQQIAAPPQIPPPAVQPIPNPTDYISLLTHPPQPAAIGMTSYHLAHAMRGQLLELITAHWSPTLQALSVVAFDPLATLIVRSPTLDLWANAPIPHIRIHLPRGTNSLAVFKGAAENRRDRHRNQRATNQPPMPGADDDADDSEEGRRIVGGDGHGGGLVNDETRLFEIEVNTLREMEDDMWDQAGGQLPPQVCRMLVGEAGQGWESVRWRAGSTPWSARSRVDESMDVDLEDAQSVGQSSEGDYPMSDFEDLDLEEDGEMEDEDEDEEDGRTYDRAAAEAQGRRMSERNAAKQQQQQQE